MMYYLDQDIITDQPLPGIQPKPEITPAKNDLILKNSYEHTQVDIRSLLLPQAPGRLKKLRVKRRRIRNHFQGADHLEQVAVTVSWLARGNHTLIGIRVRIASNVGLKALDASESYLLETIAPEQRGLVSICHALLLLIQLMLTTLTTRWFRPQVRGESITRLFSTCCSPVLKTWNSCRPPGANRWKPKKLF